MNNLQFPLLSANDIEVRVGNFNKEKTKCTLLLYKTARTDAFALDNHPEIGCFNWQKKFYELKGVIYCSLGIYDKERNEWVWKDDAGAETQVETEKGQASDAFKRAGFAWGIGRELYSAPTIWVDNPTIYADFEVESISYDNNRRIKDLVIIAKDKTNNYQKVQLYPKGRKVSQNVQNAPLNENYGLYSHDKGSITPDQARKINVYLSGLEEYRHEKFFSRMEQKYGVGSVDFLSEANAQEIIDNIK